MNKVEHTFIGRVWLHPDEGGAWISECIFGVKGFERGVHAAFSTAEYGKKWVLSYLLANTSLTELEWEVADEFPHPSEDEPVAFRTKTTYEDFVKF
jgi:hypothetical protein